MKWLYSTETVVSPPSVISRDNMKSSKRQLPKRKIIAFRSCFGDT